MAPPKIQPLGEYMRTEGSQAQPLGEYLEEQKSPAQQIAERNLAEQAAQRPKVEYFVNEDNTVNVMNPDGTEFGSVPEQQAIELFQVGWLPMSEEQSLQARDIEYKREKYDAPDEAFVTGAMRGITMGALDMLADPETRQHYAKLAAANPTASIAGEIASYINPYGAVAKVGKIGAKGGVKLAEIIAKKGVGKASAKAAAKLQTGLEVQLMKNAVPKAAANNVAKKIAETSFKSAVASTAGRGAAEGLAIGLQSEISRSYLTETNLDVTNVAKTAVWGGVIGGVLGGLGSAVSKGTSRIRPLTNKVFKKEKDILSKQNEISVLQKELDDLSPAAGAEIIAAENAVKNAADNVDWVNKFQQSMSLKKSAAVGDSLKKEIQRRTDQLVKLSKAKSVATQSLAADLAKQAFNKQVLGGILGYSASGGLAGSALGMAAAAATANPAIRKVTYKTLNRMFNFSDKVKSKVGPWAIKYLHDLKGASIKRVAIIKMLTQSEIDAVGEEVSDLNTNILKNDYYIGYRAGGLPEEAAENLATFQKNRIDLLKQVIPRKNNALANAGFSKIVDGVVDPRRALIRVLIGKGTREDVLVLKTLLPDLFNHLKTVAEHKLKTDKNLTMEETAILKRITAESMNTQVIQQAAYGKQEQEAPKNKGPAPKAGQRGRTPMQKEKLGE